MRVKKYKRVRRQKTQPELQELTKGQRGTSTKREISQAPGRTEESESYTAVEGDDERSQEVFGNDLGQNNAVLSEKNQGCDTNVAARTIDEKTSNTLSRKKGGDLITSANDRGIVDVTDVHAATISAPPSNFNGDDDTPPGNPTPRTIACSEEVSLTPPGSNFECNRAAIVSSTLREGRDTFEDHDALSSDRGGSNCDKGKFLVRGGSLWFKVEHVVCFLQLLALAMDVDGASWPPLFVKMWSWTWFTTGYLRWPLLALIRRVGRAFSLTFGERELDLWFFRDVVGYGLEVYAAAVVAFALFFVLQMPDYTSNEPKAAWKRSFLIYWFRLTLLRYLLNLSLCFAMLFALTYCGSLILSEEVIKGVVVVGGTLVMVTWLSVVILSFAVHVTIGVVTKHDAEYSFIIAIKHAVKIKGRVCLFILHLVYIPVTVSIVRALLPVFDWNDNWTKESRRHYYNYHVSCYFLGFPPHSHSQETWVKFSCSLLHHVQFGDTNEITVLDCTSESGVAVYTLSVCLLLLFTCGLPNMVRYLVRFLFAAVESSDGVIRSFSEAKEVHHAALDSLALFPKDAVWLEKRRREVSLIQRVAKRSRWKMWRAVISCMRRVTYSKRLPGVRFVRRKNVGAYSAEDEECGMDNGSSGVGVEVNELGGTREGEHNEIAVVIGVNERKNDNNQNERDLEKITTRLWSPGTDQTLNRSFGSRASDDGPNERLETKLTAGTTVVTAVGIDEDAAVSGNKELTRRRRAAAQPSSLAIYLRKRKRACTGLTEALLAERNAFCNAEHEYVLALSNFEADHTLEITCWESVVDTSGLVYLSESYTWSRPAWKVVESFERCVCATAIILSRQIGPASTQFLVGALVLAVFQVYTLQAEPFLYLNDAVLDFGLRVTLIIFLCIGAGIASDIIESHAADAVLLAIGASGALAVLLSGDAIGAVLQTVGRTVTLVDDRASDFLFCQVSKRSLGLECSHSGLRLLAQWDDLLEQQRRSAFLAWPTPTPSNLLSTYEKFMLIRWAALRGIDIRRARTSTGMSLLHDSIIKAEVEPARWLVHLYPTLLESETLHKESPILLGMLETARVMLKIEELGVRLENWSTGISDNASQTASAESIGSLIGGAAGQGEKKRAADEEELGELTWKIGKLMEIFLSTELQNTAIKWNTHQYNLLTEHGEPDMSELAQHLAEAFNFRPPQGYALRHRWRTRAQFIREYLGEATCASRSKVELPGCGLGDLGYKTLLSICRSLSIPATTFTWPSAYITHHRIHVVKLDLTGNRLQHKSGCRIAEMLLLNKTLEDLNLSDNALGSQAASEIFFAVRKSETLKKLDLARNRIGPEAGDALGGMISTNRSLSHLDLSDNQMGERNFWKNMSEFSFIPSAGPVLGKSLRLNKTLTVLKVKGNLLGAETGQAFAKGVERHHSLTSLDLSCNLILPQGGRTIAMHLGFLANSSLTSLDLSDNHLGKKAGKLFSSMLKRNRTLRHLDLSRNELGTQTGVAFATALQVNQTLESLALGGNGMGPNVAKRMAQTLKQNTSLQSLDLSGNALGYATVDGGNPSGEGLVLGDGLRSNTSLKSLNLSDNHLPAQEMQHITDGFCAHPSLSRLTLAGETLDDTAARNVGRLAASDRLVSLDLSRTALAGSGAIAVIHALSSARGLKYLDLSDSSLGEGAATRELAIALQGTISVDRATERFPVRVLRLARCNLGPTGGALVARALGAKCSVEELDLSDNGLGAVAGKALAKSLRVQYLNGKQVRPCTIRRLDVSHNPLGNGAGVAVLGALTNDSTEYLDLSHTELRGKMAGCAIGRMLRCPTIVLRYLNVKHNALGRDGVNKVFWAIRRNTSLLHLDLSDNNVGSVFGTEADELEEYGTTSIQSALSLNQTLRSLALGTNGLSAECGITLITSMDKNLSLAKVSLENNLLDDHAAITIARKLSRDSQIEHLNINNNRIGWRGGVDLAAAVALNTHLKFFDAGNNMLGEGGSFAEVGVKFGDALVRNKALTSLSLEGNKLGPSGGVAIAEALHRNNSLVHLNLEDNRFDQDVGFALENLLKVNFTIRKVGASAGEIGIDSRGTIDDMLAARERVLETNWPSVPLLAGATLSAPAIGPRKSGSPCFSSSDGGLGVYDSDSVGSVCGDGRQAR